MVTTHPIAALRAFYGVNQAGLGTLSRGGVSASVIKRMERGVVEPTLFNVAAICPPDILPERLLQALATYRRNYRSELAAFAAWLRGEDVDGSANG